MGGIHALEHTLIAMFPLFALADRNDIGGISTPAHPQVGKAAIFIYDGYPGGVGLAARAYTILEELLRRTLRSSRPAPARKAAPPAFIPPSAARATNLWTKPPP
jgi:DEAD/DEAH box helicase domain-containing protein